MNCELRAERVCCRHDANVPDVSMHRLHIAVTMCNDRGPEAVNMLKSTVIFTSQPMMMHIFADVRECNFGGLRELMFGLHRLEMRFWSIWS